jgi:hypothetical protein
MKEYASPPMVNVNWGYNNAANPQVDAYQVAFFDDAIAAGIPSHTTLVTGSAARSISSGRFGDGVKFVRVRAGVEGANVWSDWSEVVKVTISANPTPVPIPKPDPPTDIWIG